MARYGKHADRLEDQLVHAIWNDILRCDFDQALMVRNLAAGHAASLVTKAGGNEHEAAIQEMLLAVLEADAWTRRRSHKALETVAEYREYRTEHPDAPSYKTLNRTFGGWENVKRKARVLLTPEPNRHLMIREGVSQTGGRRRPWEDHECVATLAACIEANFGHRPSQEQLTVWLRNQGVHMPSVNSIRDKIGWYDGIDRAVELIKANPGRYPRSSRLYQLTNELVTDDRLRKSA